jgi:hypothetical protein
MNKPRTVAISEEQAAFIVERGGIMSVFRSSTVVG